MFHPKPKLTRYWEDYPSLLLNHIDLVRIFNFDRLTLLFSSKPSVQIIRSVIRLFLTVLSGSWFTDKIFSEVLRTIFLSSFPSTKLNNNSKVKPRNYEFHKIAGLGFFTMNKKYSWSMNMIKDRIWREPFLT